MARNLLVSRIQLYRDGDISYLVKSIVALKQLIHSVVVALPDQYTDPRYRGKIQLDAVKPEGNAAMAANLNGGINMNVSRFHLGNGSVKVKFSQIGAVNFHILHITPIAPQDLTK